MDIFGICVLGVVTAVGGGMTRDVILGKLPSALEKPVYVGVSVATALAIFILLYIKQDLLSGRLGTFYDKAMLGMDSVGLGIFTSLGVMSGIDNGYPDNTFLLVFIGMLTGVGGGLMRDMMAGEEPYIFVKHIYACIPVRPLSEGRTTSLFYRLFSKTATVKTRFSDGADSTESVPPETGSP